MAEIARKRLRVAMPAWEIGRVNMGLGAKIGGLAVVVEELPPELVKAASRQGIDLEVVTLTPCFAFIDRARLTPVDLRLPVTLSGHTFEFEVYEHTFPDGQKVAYFWDDFQLNWTTPAAVYPSDPQMGLRLYAAMSQAMAGYIRQGDFQTIHLHDYHVGLIPFYLGDDVLRDAPVHLTIHNASYQGIIPLIGGGYASLDRINLPGEKLFHKYFDFFDNLNLLKACMLKVHENGGKITTVSGDLAGTWGYAAELREAHADIWSKALAIKGSPPGEVFVPNRHLDLFEKLPVAGITNGMSVLNRPEHLPELKAEVLREVQRSRGAHAPLFRNPAVHSAMLGEDHSFDLERLHVKKELKRLLHLEMFDFEPSKGGPEPILLTCVGRLVDQKNLGLVADIVERTLAHDPGAKFIILASAPEGDAAGKGIEAHFFYLSRLYPHRVAFNSSFNLPLSKLILAGGDFSLIPSRFEPCGLVDYESSLLGNVVIGRATGGLTKVAHCAYLYQWLDISDRAGEAGAFFGQVAAAIDTFRGNPARHGEMVRSAMAIDASWDASANRYVNMYRYGFLTRRWKEERRQLVGRFLDSLGNDHGMFMELFVPGLREYGDAYDWELKNAGGV
jgi:glycogen synthase